MTNTLRAFILFVAASMVGFSAGAREIDNEKTISTEQIQLGQDLPRTTVIRMRAGTNEAEVFHSTAALPASDNVKALVSSSSYLNLDSNGRQLGELDRDGSSSAWYFYYPYYYYPYSYYPYYSYYGYRYAYVPYYSYSYYGYNYYYYGWPYYNPYCRW